jgi:hypothetical protein
MAASSSRVRGPSVEALCRLGRPDEHRLVTQGDTQNGDFDDKACIRIVGLLLVTQLAAPKGTKPITSEQLASQTVHRRAVDAVIWGLPLVGEDAVKQASFRDGKATYNDIVWWSKGGGWKNQSPTPNVNTRYMYFFCNTRQDGPVAVELPPAVPGASFYGTIEDAWYVPLVDIGFEGKGGKYLVLPPTTRAMCRMATPRCVPQPTTP